MRLKCLQWLSVVSVVVSLLSVLSVYSDENNMVLDNDVILSSELGGCFNLTQDEDAATSFLVYGFMDQRSIDSINKFGEFIRFDYEYLVPELAPGADNSILQGVATWVFSGPKAIAAFLIKTSASPGRQVCPDEPVGLIVIKSLAELIERINLYRDGTVEAGYVPVNSWEH